MVSSLRAGMLHSMAHRLVGFGGNLGNFPSSNIVVMEPEWATDCPVQIGRASWTFIATAMPPKGPQCGSQPETSEKAANTESNKLIWVRRLPEIRTVQQLQNGIPAPFVTSPPTCEGCPQKNVCGKQVAFVLAQATVADSSTKKGGKGAGGIVVRKWPCLVVIARLSRLYEECRTHS